MFAAFVTEDSHSVHHCWSQLMELLGLSPFPPIYFPELELWLWWDLSSGAPVAAAPYFPRFGSHSECLIICETGGATNCSEPWDPKLWLWLAITKLLLLYTLPSVSWHLALMDHPLDILLCSVTAPWDQSSDFDPPFPGPDTTVSCSLSPSHHCTLSSQGPGCCCISSNSLPQSLLWTQET